MSKCIWENLPTTKRSKIIMWEDRELTNKESVPVLTQGCCSKHTVSSRHSTSKPDLFAKKRTYLHTRKSQAAGHATSLQTYCYRADSEESGS